MAVGAKWQQPLRMRTRATCDEHKMPYKKQKPELSRRPHNENLPLLPPAKFAAAARAGTGEILMRCRRLLVKSVASVLPA